MKPNRQVSCNLAATATVTAKQSPYLNKVEHFNDERSYPLLFLDFVCLYSRKGNGSLLDFFYRVAFMTLHVHNALHVRNLFATSANDLSA